EERGGMLGGPPLARVARGKEEDVVAETRHDVGGGCAEGRRIGPNEGDNGIAGFDGFDPVRRYGQPHELADFRIRRCNAGGAAENFWDEEAVPRAPGPERTATHLEAMVHWRRGKPAEAEHAPLSVGVDKALDRIAFEQRVRCGWRGAERAGELR